MDFLMFYEFWTILILIPPALFAMYAQMKVSSTFSKYDKVASKSGLTGKEVAETMLERAGVGNVKIEHVKGKLSDHYDPRTCTLRLSDSTYNSKSVAAIGVAAHEVGHAIQHNHGYAPIALRNGIFPVVNIGSQLAMPLVFIGLLLGAFAESGGEVGMILMNVGIVMFSTVVVFQLITLPVEFNASGRALDLLRGYNMLGDGELVHAKKVLSAAAMTYVAAAAVAIANLVRLIIIANRRR
jgi:hypothetical protein